MKKLFFALVAMFVTMSASAQFQGMEFKPEDMAKRQADMIKEACKVNDEQYKKLYDHFLSESKTMIARMDSIQKAGVQPGQGGMPGFDRESMQKRQEAQNKFLKSVLTEEQMAAYQKAQEERRQRMMQGGFGGPRQ